HLAGLLSATEPGDGVPAGAQEEGQRGADEAVRAGDANAERLAGGLGVTGEVGGGEGVAVGEGRLERLPHHPGGKATHRTEGERVSNVVLEDGARLAVGQHPVDLLPAREGTGLLPVGEGAALVHRGVERDPPARQQAQVDAQDGAGAGADAAGALEDLDAVERRVEALEGAGAGVPVEQRPGRDWHGAPCEVTLLVHPVSPGRHFRHPPALVMSDCGGPQLPRMEVTSPESIAAAVAVLRRGGLVGLPTETVYGLAADAENELAVRRIFAVKGRPSTHPLIVHVAQASCIESWATGVPPEA